jgi:prepilin peptidase CpaA
LYSRGRFVKFGPEFRTETRSEGSLTSLIGCVKIRRSGVLGVPRAYRSSKFFPSKHEEHWKYPTTASGCDLRECAFIRLEDSLKLIVIIPALGLALIAGWTDWRSRRIPNWLTVPALLIGLLLNGVSAGWGGVKTSLLGAGLGLLVLLPFVLLRSLGAGDWKLAGALGAFVGWEALVTLLIGSMFVAGVMALILVIYKGRFKQTMRNIWNMLALMLTFRMPGAEVSLDNPQSLKVPYGVALALSTLLFGIARIGRVQ